MVRKRKTKPKTVSGVCIGVDKISGLSDDLLVKILSFLPTKDAVSTSILSKRWECLWMWLPKLKYSDLKSKPKSLRCFLDLNLPLHRAPVLESFHLKCCCSSFKPEDIKLWVLVALSRHLRKLKIIYHPYNKPNILPSSLYTCKSLVILKLSGRIRLDVPRLGCLLPSLKTLHLLIHYYLEGESLRRLLSICPVLEDLLVCCDLNTDNIGLITVTVSSLQSFSIHIPSETYGVIDGLVIDSPCLKYLKLEDLMDDGRPCSIENMPNLEEAYLDVRYPHISSLIRSITSVKCLTICSEIVYSDGFVFNQLEHLKLCLCTENSSNLLVRLLEDSPNLRVLDIFIMDHFATYLYGQPTDLHECILSSLQAFNWSRYLERRPQEKDLAIYILGKQWSLKDGNNSMFVLQSLETSDSGSNSDSDAIATNDSDSNSNSD